MENNGECCKNTDKEIWRKIPGDYYSDSIHVTEGNGIGINCGGFVIVAQIETWHRWGEKMLSLRLIKPSWVRKLIIWVIDYNAKKQNREYIKE